MARSKKDVGLDFLEPEADAVVETPVNNDAAELARLREELAALRAQLADRPAPPAPVDPAAPCKWRVRCACPTPLKHQVMEVEAPDKHQAKLAYCAANGISDSTHPWSIERID